ncbi:MAG: hypothetical protein VX727_01810 [Planctomycetota bacterium]|nr:hypothetical protein [Planctomycetota bacterium]|tara:strand:+ start:958 stop:1242 length:285 start_codon:yes stop_codon:yes gene_type:complete
MERGPILTILQEMMGTEKELDMILWGEDNPIEIRNVIDVQTLRSANGIHVTTRQNNIWFDASHVSAMWQARDDEALTTTPTADRADTTRTTTTL